MSCAWDFHRNNWLPPPELSQFLHLEYDDTRYDPSTLQNRWKWILTFLYIHCLNIDLKEKITIYIHIPCHFPTSAAEWFHSAHPVRKFILHFYASTLPSLLNANHFKALVIFVMRITFGGLKFEDMRCWNAFILETSFSTSLLFIKGEFLAFLIIWKRHTKTSLNFHVKTSA